MAKGRIMLQLEVEQHFSEAVSFAPKIEVYITDELDGDVSTVHEIAYQKVASTTPGKGVRPSQDTLDRALTEVFLISAHGQNPVTTFYGPSVVPSPPVAGPEMVVLRVFDGSFTVQPPSTFHISRRIQAHTYLSESTTAAPSEPVPEGGGTIGP